MKNYSIVAILFFIAFAKAHSQQVEGVATYQTQRHFEMAMDSTSGMSSEMNKSIQEQLRKQFQKEYTLTFNGSESSWKENATLSKPQAPTHGIQVMIAGNNDELYTNTKMETFVKQSNLMGKQFLIEDTLKKPDWELIKEIKNIGQYTCFKATLTEEIETSSFRNYNEEEKKKETRVTTAWYTLDIPVTQGPDTFWGLPGLILEVNDGKMAMMCTKIVLNPKESIAITPPSKGKRVTAQEFKTISEEKAQEMMERYSSPSKKGGDHQMIIKIGG